MRRTAPRPVRPALLAILGVLAAGSLLACGAPAPPETVVVASKKFTESVVLGEIAATLLRAEGVPARHRRELGGTRVLWEALLAGDVDAYPEYTGTLREEILADEDVRSPAALEAALEARGLRAIGPLGFENTYALALRAERAEELGVRRISDLIGRDDLEFGLTNEFLDRGDGWPALSAAYGLSPRTVRGLDHDLAYEALASGAIDVMDVYSTDAEIEKLGLAVLEDDRRHFPEYAALLLCRRDLPAAAAPALARLAGALDEEAMRRLNARAAIDRVPEARVAADFVEEVFGQRVSVVVESRAARFARNGAQHLRLVGISLGAAVLVAVPLGFVAARRPRFGHVVLAAAGVVQTFPSLALLVLFIPLLGIGAAPAIAALFLYSLLPVVRNTHAGLVGIPPELAESATALGLRPRTRLFRVDLPLALPSILAGVKIAAVLNVGTATLGALIGAGGFGEPILTGIRLRDTGLILEGALPAAALAIVASGTFDLIERLTVSRGLRA